MSVKIGRNDPCWCGSGKKYKACHQAFDERIAMIEAGANEVSDEDMFNGIMAGHAENQKIIEFIKGIQREIGKEKFDFATYRKDSLGFYVKSTSPITSLQKAEDIAGLRIIVGSGTNQEAILLAWNAQNVKKGLKPFTPIYTKDDASQTLSLQSGRADAFFGPNVTGAWKAALTGKTKRVGIVDGGWPKAAHIAVTLKKGSGLVEPVQTALNGVIKNGDYDKVLNRWGEGVERIPQSEVNPAGLGD